MEDNVLLVFGKGRSERRHVPNCQRLGVILLETKEETVAFVYVGRDRETGLLRFVADQHVIIYS